MVQIGGIDLFPPMCAVDAPVISCTFLGITVPCKEPVTPDSPFTAGAEVSHVWTFVVIFVLGISALAYVKRPWQWKDSMKITTALYSAETAFFALFRYYWGLGKPLIMGAALHNLFEWVIVIHLAEEIKCYKEFERYIAYAVFWVLTVISATLMIPDLLVAFLFEQATGIMLDFAMPLMFLNKFLFSRDEETRKFFRLPALAHTAHILFTIIPLVMANFHVGYVSWYSSFYLEMAIYISVPVTHVLYIVWSHQVDRLREEKLQMTTCTGAPTTDSTKTTTSATANGNGTNHNGQNGMKSQSEHLLPANLQIKGTAKYLGVGFFLGVLTLIVYPTLVLGPCPDNPMCTPSGRLTGSSVARVNPGYELAFEDIVASSKLVEKARSAPGNMGYDLIKNMQDSTEYRFIEKWASYTALQNWLNGYPKQLFESSQMKMALEGGKLQNLSGYAALSPDTCRPDEFGALTLDVGSPCRKVWKVIGNWRDCSWVIGCSSATVDIDTATGNKFRIMHMQDGSKMKVYLIKHSDSDHSLTYEVDSPSNLKGYRGTVSMKHSVKSSCTMQYEFAVPRSLPIDATNVVEDFEVNRIPALKKMFAK